MHWGKITSGNPINNTVVLHYLVNINAGIYIPRNMLFYYFAIQDTPGGECCQHSITTVYISTLTNKRDPFDLKFIPSQTDITEQQFSEDISVSMFTNSTIHDQI